MAVILITGASGFVGRHAVTALRGAGHEVHGLSRRPRVDEACIWHTVDVLDGAAVSRLFERVRPSHLLHFAWETEHGRYWTAPENLHWVEATLHLVRRFYSAGGQRFVGAGTCAEYAWDEAALGQGPVTELGALRRPRDLYGIAKGATFDLLTAYCARLSLSFAWGRLFFPYGAPDRRPTLMPSVIRALRCGQPARCTDGRQRRDFIHVRDAGAAFAALLTSEVTGPVNIASGAPTSIAEVVTLLGSLFGRPELIHLGALERPRGDPDCLFADVERLRNEVGFVPKTELRGGLQETVAWWAEQPYEE